MTEQQHEFCAARDRLIHAVENCGFPAELAELCAKQIGSPKGIDRLTSYVYNVRPHNIEMLVDKMLAITDQIHTWRERKTSEEAQWKYSMWLNSEERQNEEPY